MLALTYIHKVETKVALLNEKLVESYSLQYQCMQFYFGDCIVCIILLLTT